MRFWRSAKTLGCASLRDGVYLLPDTVAHEQLFADVVLQTQEVGGNAAIYYLSGRDEVQTQLLTSLFDRTEDYAALVEEIKALKHDPTFSGAARKLPALVRRFEQIVNIDFFPTEIQRHITELLDDLKVVIARRLSADEPTACHTDIPSRECEDYQRRIWATRARPWVDRLASAWLIQRFIDPAAKFIWFATPADCQHDWLGFDFDGATFSHVGNKVTFETLLASFGLEQNTGMARIAELVHYLDIGGLPIPEAQGIETLLRGLLASEPDDDKLLARAAEIFDWLLKSYKDNP